MKPCPGPKNEWHRHPNGGGWVKNTASVPDRIFVGEYATIWGGTFWGGTFWGGTFRGGEFRGGTFRGGEFRGGTFEGGTFWGGTFWGGTFRGGAFWGGTFRGGTFRGGTFRGGTFWGGTFRGGEFWGGTFWGGTFEGGTFEGGTVLDGIWSHSPLIVYGSRHPVCNAKPGHLMIGCRCEPFDWWTTPDAEKFAIGAGYTEAERGEYRQIVALVRKIGV